MNLSYGAKSFQIKQLFVFLSFFVLTFSIIFADLTVTPDDDFVSTGPQAGPFAPAQMEYVLTNNGDTALYWGVDGDADWLDFDTEWDVLDANQAISVIVRLCTHKIDGLHENDFILAAKIDNLPT